MADMTAKETSPTRSCSVTETVSGSNLFVIQGYSLAKGIGVGKHIASEEFTTGGHKWAIYFYPDGKCPQHNSSYVSVFIALTSDSTDVRAVFSLTLMDQSGKGKHKVMSCFKLSSPHTLKFRGSLWGYKRLVRKAMLEKSDYLRDDCLKIYCNVGVVVSAIDCSRLPSIQVPDSNIGSHIGMLLENTEGCDITFNVSGEKLHAHKLILAVRSPKLLEGVNSEEKEVKVPDMEPKVFKALLHFIYRDALAEDALAENELMASSFCSAPLVGNTLTAKLLAAADRYDLERLKRICESHLCKVISVKSVTQALALAKHYHAAGLKNVCLQFAGENLEELLACRGCVEDCSNSGGKSGSVVARAQLCDGDEAQPSDGGDKSNSGGKSGCVGAQLCDGDEAQPSDGGDNSGGKSGSAGARARAQLCDGDEAEPSDGGDSNGRRLKQKVEEL